MIGKNSHFIYEFPLNETIRQFLRLEHGFNQLDKFIHGQEHSSGHSALFTLIHLLEFLQRVDIKTDLIKELEHRIQAFEDLSDNPSVDGQKLSVFLSQLSRLHQWVLGIKGKPGQSSFEHPFVQNILKKPNLNLGLASCDSPELASFLRRPVDHQVSVVEQLTKPINGLKTSIEVLLKLVRDNSKWLSYQAPMGDFLIEKPAPELQLIRIQTEKNEIFPELSAGKHRIAIHFFQLDDKLRRLKFAKPVDFTMSTNQP